MLRISKAVRRVAAGPYPIRLRAAKRLRHRARPVHAGQMLTVSRDEIAAGVAEHNWEFVYHLIMGIAEAGYRDSYEDLMTMALQVGHPEAIYVALGDAIVRLGRRSKGDASPLFWCLAQNNRQLADGGFRAAAMLHETYSAETCEQLLASVEGTVDEEPVTTFRFWPAAAAAGWSGPAVHDFLTSCLTSERDDVREAASLSLRGKYKNCDLCNSARRFARRQPTCRAGSHDSYLLAPGLTPRGMT